MSTTVSPEIGEELSTALETANTHDCFAVAIRKGTLTIGHVPGEISKVCWFVLRHGGTIKCRVSTDRHRRSLLKQGGLKVPCKLIFAADDYLHTHTNNYIIYLCLLGLTQSEKKDRS